MTTTTTANRAISAFRIFTPLFEKLQPVTLAAMGKLYPTQWDLSNKFLMHKNLWTMLERYFFFPVNQRVPQYLKQ
jgi:hypothetical protein